ncbi:MAG: acetyl-CoA carboxylase biotin carboxyl carrier protein [Bacteroidetes bacterium]|nr:acetyl-CoA carboxylase biotin carboxyl carrier protein [Bacteroidota bacterium]MBS1629173.1 acetyl-CoA carboxylase biotin carboxyl carrier protein [Bacteroidota bacterium]
MEFKQIQELIKTINKSNISELSIQDGEFQITIKQGMEPNPEMAMHMMMPAMQPLPAIAPQMPIAPAAPSAPALPAAPPVVAESSAAGNTVQIKSPMIGTFYRSSSPDKPPFVSVGDEIKKGQVLCVVEAMKLFNEIESEISGRIVKVLADDASPVEYDQPLFLVEPA